MPAPGNRPDASILAALRAQIPVTQSFDVVETTFEPRDPVSISEPIARAIPIVGSRTISFGPNGVTVQPARADPRLVGYAAGDVLRAVNAHPGTVTIEGTGTAADGRYALEQFSETDVGQPTVRLRRVGS